LKDCITENFIIGFVFSPSFFSSQRRPLTASKLALFFQMTSSPPSMPSEQPKGPKGTNRNLDIRFHALMTCYSDALPPVGLMTRFPPDPPFVYEP
jgi:hypothetical protein